MTPDRVAEALAALERVCPLDSYPITPGVGATNCAKGGYEDALFIARWLYAAPALLKLARLAADVRHGGFVGPDNCAHCAALAELAETVLRSAEVRRDGEHTVTFSITVKGFGHKEQVTRETQETLERILRLAFRTDYSQAVVEVS